MASSLRERMKAHKLSLEREASRAKKGESPYDVMVRLVESTPPLTKDQVVAVEDRKFVQDKENHTWFSDAFGKNLATKYADGVQMGAAVLSGNYDDGEYKGVGLWSWDDDAAGMGAKHVASKVDARSAVKATKMIPNVFYRPSVASASASVPLTRSGVSLKSPVPKMVQVTGKYSKVLPVVAKVAGGAQALLSAYNFFDYLKDSPGAKRALSFDTMIDAQGPAPANATQAKYRLMGY